MKVKLAAFTTFFALSLSAQDNIDSHYKIYDTRLKQIITIDKIVTDMADADVLFFGELHDDSICHYLETEIFKALHQKFGDQVALSLEMFETDNQVALNDYLAGFIPEDRFAKDVRLWNNYKDYRPMIEYSKKNHIPVIAANPPRRYVSMVTRRGMKSLDSLGKEAKKYLPPLPYDTLGGRYREKFMETMKGAPESASKNIYYSQSLWDAGMSYSIYRYLKNHKKQKVFHCVGGFHTEEKLGTAAQLQMRNKKLKILNIASFRDKSFSNPDLIANGWEKESYRGDYLIITDPDLKKTF
ncbi:MAG: ChaN family lipoprotein [Sphingobacteriales bacterium]|nr:ChaN family lipoprotein [Sphingobacteriales bacterium]